MSPPSANENSGVQNLLICIGLRAAHADFVMWDGDLSRRVSDHPLRPAAPTLGVFTVLV